jgi:AMP nucleosidase
MAYKKPLRPDSYAEHTLRRYSGSEPKEFRRYVLLTNFPDYVASFKALGENTHHSKAWDVVHNAELDCSLVNFGIGSPLAAMTMHCVGYLDQVDAVIMLGLAGGLAEQLKVGDSVLPFEW